MEFEMLVEYLPFLLPLLLAQLALGITALIHVLRHANYRFGNKVMWAVIVMLVQIIGPVIYFIFGRGDD